MTDTVAWHRFTTIMLVLLTVLSVATLSVVGSLLVLQVRKASEVSKQNQVILDELTSLETRAQAITDLARQANRCFNRYVQDSLRRLMQKHDMNPVHRIPIANIAGIDCSTLGDPVPAPVVSPTGGGP